MNMAVFLILNKQSKTTKKGAFLIKTLYNNILVVRLVYSLKYFYTTILGTLTVHYVL